jgi:hypothetical protein
MLERQRSAARERQRPKLAAPAADRSIESPFESCKYSLQAMTKQDSCQGRHELRQRGLRNVGMR